MNKQNIDLVNFFNSVEKRKSLKTFFISYIIVILAFGSKLTNQSYPADDYSRLFLTENWFTQSDRGRWFTSILNHFIFNGELFVLPYFNTVLALFFIALGGFIISVIWDVKNQLFIGILILFVTISPFWANNLYYNSNVTVGFGTFLASLGLLQLIKKRKIYLSLLLLILSFGVYQTIFQASLIIVIGSFLFTLFEVDSKSQFYNIIKKYALFIFYIVLAFVVSQIISEVIMSIANVSTLFNPYNKVTREINILSILKKFIYIFTSSGGFVGNLFLNNRNFGIVTCAFFILGSYSYGILIYKKLSFVRKELLIVFFILIPILAVIIQSPRILGVAMPIRSCFHFAILIALVVVFSLRFGMIVLKNISILLVIVFITMSFKYISTFYDYVNRQHQSDIIIANQIVNRIRQHPDYHYKNGEIPKFKIIGNNLFPVVSEYSKKNEKDLLPVYLTFQPFNADWSKYKIFEHFTDFNFMELNKYKSDRILQHISTNKNTIGEYPEKNSILFIDDVIVLVLDKESD